MSYFGKKSRIPLVFMDDALFNEGVPSNFRGVIPGCQTSPLVKYLEYCSARDQFVHTRLADLAQQRGFLIVGLFGNPLNWYGADGTGTPPLSSRIPDLRRILERHSKLQILIDYTWEAGLGDAFFPGVDSFVRDLGIDPRRLLIVVTNQGIEHRYVRYLLSTNRTSADTYRVFGLDFWLMYSAIEFSRRHWWTDQSPLVRDAEIDDSRNRRRSRKFLSFNRRPRWNRYLLAMMVEQLNLRESGFISMSSPNYQGDWTSEDSRVDSYGSLMGSKEWEAIRTERDPLMKTLPWRLDINMDDESGQPEAYLFQSQSRDLFLDSYCQIITESYMEGETGDIFITEKISRALANFQPFLVFGHAHTLQRLLEHGFASSSIFDSEYDDNEEIGSRLTGIYRSLRDFSALSIDDLHQRYFAELGAIRHNRQRLFEMPSVLSERLASRLDAELWAC